MSPSFTPASVSASNSKQDTAEAQDKAQTSVSTAPSPATPIATPAASSSAEPSSAAILTSSASDSPPRPRSESEEMRIVSTVEGLTKSIIKELQKKGKMNLTQLIKRTKSDEYRVRSVLNVLLATPLVNQARKNGVRGTDSVIIMYRHGAALRKPVDLATLVAEIRNEQAQITACVSRAKRIRQEMDQEKPSGLRVVADLFRGNAPLVRDPLYRIMIKALQQRYIEHKKKVDAKSSKGKGKAAMPGPSQSTPAPEVTTSGDDRREDGGASENAQSGMEGTSKEKVSDAQPREAEPGPKPKPEFEPKLELEPEPEREPESEPDQKAGPDHASTQNGEPESVHMEV